MHFVSAEGRQHYRARGASHHSAPCGIVGGSRTKLGQNSAKRTLCMSAHMHKNSKGNVRRCIPTYGRRGASGGGVDQSKRNESERPSRRPEGWGVGVRALRSTRCTGPWGMGCAGGSFSIRESAAGHAHGCGTGPVVGGKERIGGQPQGV